jgi:predicted phosphodiesterase
MASPPRAPHSPDPLDRVAVVSDVHGNTTAFAAVLDDIDARGITTVLNLGDVVGKGPRGSEAVKLTRERCDVTVRGNWDTFISRDADLPWPHGQWVRDSLDDGDVAWLAGLPNCHDLVMSGRRVRLFHASQASEFHRVHHEHTEAEFRAMFTNTPFTGDFTAGGFAPGTTPDVVGYGDIHGTYLEADDGLTLFNAGAVGNHLDAPTAPYVVLEGVLGSVDSTRPFSLSFARVSYDIEAEIAVARDLAMPETEEYAVELSEGVFRGSRPRP